MFFPASVDQSGGHWKERRQLQAVFFLFIPGKRRLVGRHNVDVALLALCVRSGKHCVAATEKQAERVSPPPDGSGRSSVQTRPRVSQWHLQRRVGASGALGSLALLSTHSGSSDVMLSACFQGPKRLLITLFICLFIEYLLNRGVRYNVASRKWKCNTRKNFLTSANLQSLSPVRLLEYK